MANGLRRPGGAGESSTTSGRVIDDEFEYPHGTRGRATGKGCTIRLDMFLTFIVAVLASCAAVLWAAGPEVGMAAADRDQQRADLLKRMQEVMGELPDRTHLPPLDLKVSETFQGDGYRRLTVTFANLFDE